MLARVWVDGADVDDAKECHDQHDTGKQRQTVEVVPEALEAAAAPAPQHHGDVKTQRER